MIFCSKPKNEKRIDFIYSNSLLVGVKYMVQNSRVVSGVKDEGFSDHKGIATTFRW